VEVTFCWSPAEEVAQQRQLVVVGQPLPDLVRGFYVGARKALRVSADGRFTRLLPRSRKRLVLSFD